MLDQPLDLPDGTEVHVSPVERERADVDAPKQPRTLAERLAPFIGCVKGLPSDLARNHDHYLYGTPKRK